MNGSATSPGEGSAPVRVGLLLDSTTQPAWVEKIVRQCVQSDAVELVLVVVDGSGQAPRGILHKVWERRSYLLYEAYSRLDNHLFRSEPDAFRRVDLSRFFEAVPLVAARPRRTRFSDYFEGDDLERIRSREPDVLLRFGFRILRGEILSVPRHGVWSFHHGDNRVNRGGPPGFWEVMEGWPATGVVLQVLTEKLDAGRVLYRGRSMTHPYSVRRNKNHLYWRATPFVARALHHLATTGSPPESPEDDLAESPDLPELRSKPTNTAFVPVLARFLARSVAGKVGASMRDDGWILGYRLQPDLEAGPLAAGTYRALTPPSGHYWADPFPRAFDGRLAIFFEDYSHRDRKGRIAAIEIDSGGHAGPPRPIIERDWHLSYPAMFEWQDDLYMIPESVSRRAVEAYRCVSFPDRWEPAGTLLEGVRAVDATVFERGGVWWMFVNRAVVEAHNVHDELHLYRADAPLGVWAPHPCNPVNLDVSGARPAGQPFEYDGRLFRPGQDSAGGYGRAIVIHEVLELTPERYAEVAVGRVEPAEGTALAGCHTINAISELAVVDALRRSWPVVGARRRGSGSFGLRARRCRR